jgi:hypothetical protein
MRVVRAYGAPARPQTFVFLRSLDPRQTLRPTLARCALVRTIRRDRLTTLEV